MKKILTTGIALSLAVLTTASTVSATNQAFDVFVDEQGNVTNTAPILDKSAIAIVRENEAGEHEFSEDGGETWTVIAEGGFEHRDSDIDWKTLTIEDIEADIAERRKDMADTEFMEMMEKENGITRADMELHINVLEQQIEDIRNGAVIQEGITADGTMMIGFFGAENIITASAVGAIFTDAETGKTTEYQAPTLEELIVKLEKAVADGDITAEDMDKIIRDIEAGRGNQSEYEIILIGDEIEKSPDTRKSVPEQMKLYEEFGVSFEPTEFYRGNIFYNGEPVGSFLDANPNGGTLRVESVDGGTTEVRAVYDEDGNLTGMSITA